MISIIWTVFVVLLLWAGMSDAKSYRIPNWISVSLVTLFVLSVVMSGEPVTAFWPHILLGAAVLALGYILYRFTGMGAGDAKLGAASVLWAGFGGVYSWTLFLALSMAVLALALIAARWLARRADGGDSSFRLLRRGAPVPLGVALAAATIFSSGSFNPLLWAI
jgi:prepilin peptidase CpaA